MQKKAVYGKWQREVQKALLKRDLQERNNQGEQTAAKTAEQPKTEVQSIKEG